MARPQQPCNRGGNHNWPDIVGGECGRVVEYGVRIRVGPKQRFVSTEERNPFCAIALAIWRPASARIIGPPLIITAAAFIAGSLMTPRYNS